ncbi:hypothetical protein GQ457_03G008070 [Hibiscus cannabinus]
MLQKITLGTLGVVGVQRQRQHVSWSTPAHEWFKLNSDGARMLVDGRAKCGGTINDSNGNWIMDFAKGLGVCSVVVVELWGVYMCLLCVWNLNIHNVEIEVDSLEALRLIRLGAHSQSVPGIVLHIVKLCDRDWSVSFQHIHHEGNKVIDQITQFADAETLEVRWFHELLLKVGRLLHGDVGD